MHPSSCSVIWLLSFVRLAFVAPTEQHPLVLSPKETTLDNKYRADYEPSNLHGRFLHITDFHPDPFYEAYSSTEDDDDCHRGHGPAGVYGAETSDCDSPMSLVNATFQWIDKHLKDSIDFIIWTGDSARHDYDEKLPRTEDQVVELNKWMVEKYEEVFGKENPSKDPTNAFTIPIIPNFGNNDMVPHNIFNPGPNRWTRKYLNIWRKLIPEEQRHVFERGGYFFVEAIPNKLAVFSLNTLYFFDSNTAVDGCARQSEPGYKQMEWLRIQLQLIRRRGMKAILMGHVPPARTEAKISWDETCWHKYTFWMQQYRDVVVGSLFGHMNYEHFMLQDSHLIDDGIMNGYVEASGMTAFEDEISIQSSAEYLSDLRDSWRKLPDSEGVDLSSVAEGDDGEVLHGSKKKKKKPKRSKAEKFFGKIGGEWGERYSLSLVGGSIVPNYFPSLRVIEYNITGLDAIAPFSGSPTPLDSQTEPDSEMESPQEVAAEETNSTESKKWRKKPRKPQFTSPLPPSKAAPPGPAYSPQTLSWLGYTQYFANLTTINNDFNDPSSDTLHAAKKWHPGKHSGRRPKPKKNKPRDFTFEVEYDTRTDKVYNLTDLTVRSYIELASRIGRYKPVKKHSWWGKWGGPVQLESRPDAATPDTDVHNKKGSEASGDLAPTGRKHDKKKSKKAKRKAIAELWFTFVRRAYIGSRDDKELKEEFEDR
ncbi:MAG: hypothetical protein Q9195_007679 [Heterodermia aff. obscurata]